MSARELPAGWDWKPFGDVVDYSQNGCSARRGEGVPTVVLRLADVSWKDGIRTENPRVIPLDEKKRRKYALKEGDLLAIRVNGSQSLAGQVLRYDGPSDYAFCDHFIRFRLKDSVDSKFAALVFRSPSVRSQIEHRMVSSAGQHTVSQLTYSETKIPLPPIDEQRRIVSKIESLFARSRRAKEALDAIPPLLDRLRQSILAAAFRGDLTADWRAQNPDAEPADKLLERIRTERRRRWEEAQLAKMRAKGKEPKNDKWKAKYKPSPLPSAENTWPVPASWIWSVVDEVGDVVLGRRRAPEYAGAPLPYLRVANVKDGHIDLRELKEMPFDEREADTYRLQRGDVLVSEGQSLERIGQSAVYRGGGPPGLCFRSTLHRFRPTETGPSSDYAGLVFRAFTRNGMFRRHAAITTNIAHLVLKNFKRVPFPLAPRAEAVEIVRRTTTLLSRVDLLERATIQTERLHEDLEASILRDAFTGELIRPRDRPEQVSLSFFSANPSHRR